MGSRYQAMMYIYILMNSKSEYRQMILSFEAPKSLIRFMKDEGWEVWATLEMGPESMRFETR